MSNIYVDNIYEKTTGNGIRFQDDTIRSGQVIHNGSYWAGSSSSAEIETTSTAWITVNIGGSGKRGLNVNESGNVLTFEKKHNNSVIEMDWCCPYYFQGSNNDSGFGIRGRCFKPSGTVHYLDASNNAGFADGWGAGGYGGDNQAGVVNWTWSTYHKESANTDLVGYTGLVSFYLECRVWSSSNTLHLGWYNSSYPKDQLFYFREIAL